jgi:cytochrome c oxidase subunit IV
MTTVDTHLEHHDDGHAAHGHDDSHDKPDRYYVIVGIFLAALTAIEVWLSYTHFGTAGTVALFVLMGVKFWTVVSLFMHLKFDHKMFGLLFWSGLILAVVVYVAMLTTFQLWAK